MSAIQALETARSAWARTHQQTSFDFDIAPGWVFVKGTRNYCEVCRTFTTGPCWKLFSTPLLSTHTVCEGCAERLA